MKLRSLLTGLHACAAMVSTAAGRLATNLRHMSRGVIIQDPFSAWIDPSVWIARGAIIEPNVQLLGNTQIGERTRITSCTRISDSSIGADCKVERSTIDDSRLDDDVLVGPFSRIRGKSKLGRGCRIGSYADINRSTLGQSVQMNHHSYLGDATVGARTNIGAGAVTANFDGKNKHPTMIGEDAFIGTNATLVAPITLGRKAIIGAGSVVRRIKGLPASTIDVKDGETAVGVPARILNRQPN